MGGMEGSRGASSSNPGTRAGAASQPVSTRVLAICAALLVCAVLVNAISGVHTQAAGNSAIHEAAVPLQKQPRKSRYAHTDDPESPDTVVIASPRLTMANAAGATIQSRTPSQQGYSPPPPPAGSPSVGRSPAVAVPKSAADFATSVDREVVALAPAGSAEHLSCHARDGFDIAGDAAYVWGLSFNVASAAECCAACAAQRQVCGAPASRGKPFWKASRRERTQARCNGAPGLCNAWVFCPGSNEAHIADRCFSYTIHNHTRGECWLKHEKNESHPIAAGPTLPLRMRTACVAPPSRLAARPRARLAVWSVPSRASHAQTHCAAAPPLSLRHARSEHLLRQGSSLSLSRSTRPGVTCRPRRDWPWAVATNVWPWEVPEKIAWQAGILAHRAAPVWQGTHLPDWHHKFCRGKHGPC